MHHAACEADSQRASLDAVILRCTARLLKQLPDAAAPVQATPGPDDWYANLVWLDRRKCLLVVHAETLFALLIADVRQAHLRHLGPLVTGEIASATADEALAPDCLGTLDPTQLRVARTADRHILGFMNDMAALCRHAAAQAGGLATLDVGELNTFLRRTPYNRGGYVRAIDNARRRHQSA